MAENLKFFSPEWCEAVVGPVNASDAMYRGFKDPKNFTNQMEFACQDNPDLRIHLEWKEAKVVYCGPPKFDDSDLWLVIKATVDSWKEAASGRTEGGKLLMAGKIKFAKGPMSAAIENAGAFNNFLRAWGEVPTDWDV